MTSAVLQCPAVSAAADRGWTEEDSDLAIEVAWVLKAARFSRFSGHGRGQLGRATPEKKRGMRFRADLSPLAVAREAAGIDAPERPTSS